MPTDDLDDLDGVGDLTFHDDDETPETPFPCGAVVAGERVGHCSGCTGRPRKHDGCCRNFYGIKSFDKHHVLNRKDGTRRCRTDAELIDLGYVQDGPYNSWRISSVELTTDLTEREADA